MHVPSSNEPTSRPGTGSPTAHKRFKQRKDIRFNARPDPQCAPPSSPIPPAAAKGSNRFELQQVDRNEPPRRPHVADARATAARRLDDNSKTQAPHAVTGSGARRPQDESASPSNVPPRAQRPPTKAHHLTNRTSATPPRPTRSSTTGRLQLELNGHAAHRRRPLS